MKKPLTISLVTKEGTKIYRQMNIFTMSLQKIDFRRMKQNIGHGEIKQLVLMKKLATTKQNNGRIFFLENKYKASRRTCRVNLKN